MRSIDPEDFSKRPAWRRVGIYIPSLLLLGVASIVLVYLLAMQGLGWRAPLLLSPSGGGLPVLVGGTSTIASNVLVYASPNTKKHFLSIGGNYEMLLTPWRNYFAIHSYSIKETSELKELDNFKQGVLILPSALALSDTERQAIAHFRMRGGSVLATWASGTRNAAGDWNGWSFLETLGTKVLGEIPTDPPTGNLVLNGESPVSSTHPAGLRIGLVNSAERVLRLQPITPNAQIAARLMNWARIPDPERRRDGAVIFMESPGDSGRSVVFGFAESAWEAQANAVHTLIDNTLDWLAHKPQLVRAAWPYGKRSAQLVEMDTEEGFTNALRFAADMNAANYRGTFYALTSVAKQYPDIVKTLAKDFEIGYHGDIHIGFKDQSAEEQQTRFETMRADLTTILPDASKISGFRAPTESYDATTEKVLYRNGLRYHVADPSRSEARLPVLVRMENVPIEDSLVILPRTQRDDINLTQQGVEADRFISEMTEDLDLTVDMGGLGLLSIHSQNYSEGSPLAKSIPAFVADATKRKEVWTASGAEIADWWRERERFRVSATLQGPRIELNISVLGNKPVKGGSLVVMLPSRDSLPQVQGLKPRMPKPNIAQLDAYRASLVFDELQPGNYSYQVIFSR